jgi:two-component system, cell cycle response regulator
MVHDLELTGRQSVAVSQGAGSKQPERRFISRGARGKDPTARSQPPQRTVRYLCRVLVVDDDVLIRAQLCALLHGLDYEVETAASGEDALRLLRSYPCDIVVTDWQMPHMDGLALCRQVRSMEQHEHVYLLMFTVKRSQQELLAGFAAGADDYVVKGTSSEELLARLEKGRGLAHWRATHRANDDNDGDSLTDTVTGAYNFAYLMQHLPREIARAERYGRSLAVLNCDIDGIARVNEQSGGAAGDLLARGFVACATACIRKGDWMVRTGELVFMIVLPETERKGAQRVVRKLTEAFARQESASTKVPLGGAIKVTITAMDPNSDGEGTAHMRALLRSAESSQHGDKRDEKRSADTEAAFYLSDFESGSEAERGRNWPTTTKR